ncbi:hypothetical protein CFP75_36875, partial [Amycolatopsis alba DSM 44262]
MDGRRQRAAGRPDDETRRLRPPQNPQNPPPTRQAQTPPPPTRRQQVPPSPGQQLPQPSQNP